MTLRPEDDETTGWVVVAAETPRLHLTQVRLLVQLTEGRLLRLDRAHPALHHARPQFDVGAAPRHVGGDRHRARPSRLRDDLRLALVVLRVEDVVLDAAAPQHAGNRLRGIDAGRTDKDRQTTCIKPFDLIEQRGILLPLCLVDHIVQVHAPHWPVRRNDHHLKAVDLVKLRLLRLSRPRHPGQLVIHAEVVLNCDRRQRLRFTPDRHGLLGFHCLVQTVTPAATGHLSARELVDDDNLATLDDVIRIALEEGVRLEKLMDDVDLLRLLRVRALRLRDLRPLLVGGKRLVLLDLVEHL